MLPSISVVIPVYNGAPLIGAAIRSILAQTVLPDEIIVVNDGSTDETLHALLPFRDSIKVITTINRGVSSARNTGIRAARGEWIAFLDADDVWHCDKLERQFNVLDDYPGVGFCFCDYRYYDKAKRIVSNHFARFAGHAPINFDAPTRADPYAALLRENLVGTASGVVLKRDILDKTGLFETSYRQAEDYDLWLRCALVTDMIAVSETLLTKVTHDKNLTNDFLDTLLWHERVLINICSENGAQLRQGNRSKLSRRALAGIRYQIANMCFEQDKPAKALRYYLRGANSDLTLSNTRLFLYHVSRKLVRVASFGLIRNQSTAH
jgi:glycosyltransferase involved in cell wall biosynthesis